MGFFLGIHFEVQDQAFKLETRRQLWGDTKQEYQGSEAGLLPQLPFGVGGVEPGGHLGTAWQRRAQSWLSSSNLVVHKP